MLNPPKPPKPLKLPKSLKPLKPPKPFKLSNQQQSPFFKKQRQHFDRHSRLKKIILFLLFLSFLDSKPYQKDFFSLITQNDAYFNPHTDRYYTAGHSLLYASKEGDYGWLNAFGFLKGETSFSLSLSQAIYAPKAKFDLIPPREDHPYGGFLSLTFGLHHRSERMLESLGLRVGVSGKIAFAEEVQNGIHAHLGVGLAKGWATQIQNDGIINVYYEWTYRYSFLQDSLWGIDVLPNFEFAFGNANIYGKLDAVLRLGYNLKSSFLSQGIIGENGGLQSGRTYEDGLSFFVFLGAGGGYVLRKMAIEGNLFKHNFIRNIDLETWVGNLEAGISLLSGVMSLTYKVLYLSKEFKQQDGAHIIGSIALSCSF